MNRYRLSSGLSRVRLALGLALLGALVHAAPVLAGPSAAVKPQWQAWPMQSR